MLDRAAVTALSSAGEHLMRVYRGLVLATEILRLDLVYFPTQCITSVSLLVDVYHPDDLLAT